MGSAHPALQLLNRDQEVAPTEDKGKTQSCALFRIPIAFAIHSFDPTGTCTLSDWWAAPTLPLLNRDLEIAPTGTYNCRTLRDFNRGAGASGVDGGLDGGADGASGARVQHGVAVGVDCTSEVFG